VFILQSVSNEVRRGAFLGIILREFLVWAALRIN